LLKYMEYLKDVQTSSRPHTKIRKEDDDNINTRTI
jgi:hypothetical protein